MDYSRANPTNHGGWLISWMRIRLFGYTICTLNKQNPVAIRIQWFFVCTLHLKACRSPKLSGTWGQLSGLILDPQKLAVRAPYVEPARTTSEPFNKNLEEQVKLHGTRSRNFKKMERLDCQRKLGSNLPSYGQLDWGYTQWRVVFEFTSHSN